MAVGIASDPPIDSRPDWEEIGASSDAKSFNFKVSIHPGCDRTKQNWHGSGWSEILALVDRRPNGSDDKEPRLALTHRFKGDLGYLFMSEQQRRIVPKNPERIIFPPAYDAGKSYYVPIHGYLFSSNKPQEDYVNFYWIPDSKTPNGIPPIRRDSLCIPQHFEKYETGVSFLDRSVVGAAPRAELYMISAKQADTGKSVAVAEIECITGSPGEQLRGTATIREGNIVVVPRYFGFVVRHIVPRSEKTLAIGWVDLDCHLIEEKDLEAKAKKENRSIVRFDMKYIKPKK